MLLFFLQYRGSIFSMDGLSDLRQFIDLGGIFILSLLMMYGWFKKLSKMDQTLTKILTLLTVLIKESTSFNHVNKVLGDQKKEVVDTINSLIEK